jgi:GNAT superfamily N-acetyltransferase
MPNIATRPVRREDYADWKLLWDGYNEFYGRAGSTALPDAITARTWERFFDPAESVFSLIAESDGRVVGLANYLFHRSTSRPTDVCYLQDLFTAVDQRGRGIGRRLIDGVMESARAAGCCRVYWHTHAQNAAARALYDRTAEHRGFIVYARDA